MALSDNAIVKTRESTGDALPVLDAAVVYKGSILATNSPDHATAASRGRTVAWASTTTQIPSGIADNGATGNTAETEDVRAYYGAYMREDTAVTGASTQQHVGSIVYESDDNTLTLTRPTLGSPAGRIMQFNTSTSFDIHMYSIGVRDAIALGGNGQTTEHLATIVTELGATADLVKGWEAGYNGRILSVYAICVSAPVDADMAMTFLLEIDGTNVTGGVVTLATADTAALKLSGTAITALNTFSEGSLIDIEATVTGAGTAGDGIYNVYIEVERLLGV